MLLHTFISLSPTVLHPHLPVLPLSSSFLPFFHSLLYLRSLSHCFAHFFFIFFSLLHTLSLYTMGRKISYPSQNYLLWSLPWYSGTDYLKNIRKQHSTSSWSSYTPAFHFNILTLKSHWLFPFLHTLLSLPPPSASSYIWVPGPLRIIKHNQTQNIKYLTWMSSVFPEIRRWHFSQDRYTTS